VQSGFPRIIDRHRIMSVRDAPGLPAAAAASQPTPPGSGRLLPRPATCTGGESRPSPGPWPTGRKREHATAISGAWPSPPAPNCATATPTRRSADQERSSLAAQTAGAAADPEGSLRVTAIGG
jgi:hypothetical protein